MPELTQKSVVALQKTTQMKSKRSCAELTWSLLLLVKAVAPEPEPPPSSPAAPPELTARRRGLSPALAVAFGLALGAAGVWFALHSLPKRGSVEVSTMPPEARVYAGEKLLGMTPFVAPNLAVPSTLELRIVASGHAEWTGTVSVDADRPHRALEITLAPAR